MGYQPIEDYGVVGNMRTVALVGKNGSIDWFCFPRFDSPSVFAAILDDEKGGRFRIAPTREDVTYKQFYWPETNILVTRFLSPDGIGEVVDYMPMPVDRHQLVRHVRAVRGRMGFRMECCPAFNYARDSHRVEITESRACFNGSDLGLVLTGAVPMKQQHGGVIAEFTLSEGQEVIFTLGLSDRGDDSIAPLSPSEATELLSRTVDYWRRWLSQCTYTGRWREMVYRSALALKLLTYEPTGAIVAAPTCSLPEDMGGERNWDYRYTWIRDASFTLYGLMRIGFTETATRFMEWLDGRCHELQPDGSLNIVYGIDGTQILTEEVLAHLEGYKGSRPVRIGNGAYRQFQLDIYGELMDSVYLYNKYGAPVSFELWTHLRRLVDWVCENWHRKDQGIWEIGADQQHFVYSKLMCWVALDRALRLAAKRSFPADHARWMQVRDQIYEDVITKGWNARLQAFVQSYGSEHLDAANLMMPLVFFVSPTDPMMLSTLDAISRTPRNGGLTSSGLVYRYDVERTPDGIKGEEGTFSICTFWLVEAMTRAGRYDHARLEGARLIFEQMLGYANHLGLYAEEIGPGGEALGNFPQAFTHLAFISAAFNLDRALGARGLSTT